MISWFQMGWLGFLNVSNKMEEFNHFWLPCNIFHPKVNLKKKKFHWLKPVKYIVETGELRNSIVSLYLKRRKELVLSLFLLSLFLFIYYYYFSFIHGDKIKYSASSTIQICFLGFLFLLF